MKKLILAITFLIGINIFLYADFKQVNRVKRSGDTMTGTLDMGNSKIINIGASGTDFSGTGGLTLSDDLDMGNNNIVNGSTIVLSGSASAPRIKFEAGYGEAWFTISEEATYRFMDGFNENSLLDINSGGVALSVRLNMDNNSITNIDWSNSDDGSGSLLDADFLDALQGSAYQLQLTTPSWKAFDSDLLDGKNFDAFLSTAGDIMSGDLFVDGNIKITGGTLTVFETSIGEIFLGDDINNSFIMRFIEADKDIAFELTADDDNADIFIRTKGAGTLINALTIKGSGEVGIGTTTPVSLLSVDGDSEFAGEMDLKNNKIVNISEINVSSINARNSNGLFLLDDGNNGIFIEDGGNIGIGTVNPSGILDIKGTNVSYVFGSAVTAELTQTTYRNESGQTTVKGFYSRGTLASPLVVQNGDLLFQLTAAGMDANSGTFRETATIRFRVDGTPGVSDMPGRIEFLTSPDGSSTPAIRMTIKEDGKVGIGDESPQVKLDIAGELALNTDLDIASAPAKAGIIGIDSNFDVYVSTGTGAGAWVKIGGQ